MTCPGCSKTWSDAGEVPSRCPDCFAPLAAPAPTGSDEAYQRLKQLAAPLKAESWSPPASVPSYAPTPQHRSRARYAWILAGVLGLVLLAGAMLLRQSPATAVPSLTHAQELFDRGHFAEAYEAALQFLHDSSPDQAQPARQLAAESAFKAAMWDEAVTQYKSLASAFPQQPDYRSRLAQARAAQARENRELAQLKVNEAREDLTKREPEQALAVARAALELLKSSQGSKAQLGAANLVAGKASLALHHSSEAVSYLGKAASLLPGEREPRQLLATLTRPVAPAAPLPPAAVPPQSHLEESLSLPGPSYPTHQEPPQYDSPPFSPPRQPALQPAQPYQNPLSHYQNPTYQAPTYSRPDDPRPRPTYVPSATSRVGTLREHESLLHHQYVPPTN